MVVSTSTELVTSYLPIDRRHAIAANQPLSRYTEGSALFVDIAGFTPLTEALVDAIGPQRGAEELAGLLNDIYDGLISRVHRYRGSVVGFVGDGLTCWFDGDEGERAVACGLEMQEAVRPFASLFLPAGGRGSISIRVGVAAGPAQRLVVGDPQIQRIDVLTGATLTRMAQAEKNARQGEVVVAHRAARRMGQRLLASGQRNGFAIVSGLAAQVQPDPWPLIPASAVSVERFRPYLLPPVYERLMAGQGEFLATLRPATLLFIRFGGIDYDQPTALSRLDAYIRHVQQTLAQYEGFLLQLTIGDKGSFLYAIFGAPIAHEDDTARAIAAALDLQQLPTSLQFITPPQIGVSQGLVRAGAYGSEARKTYGALGDEVNVAARLMETAPPGEVRCSARVRRAAGEKWIFRPLPPVILKGRTKALPIHTPIGPSQEPRGTRGETLVGREAELALLSSFLDEIEAGQQVTFLLEGEAGVGKSRLVRELERMARERGLPWLEGAASSIERQTPYLAWRDPLRTHFGLLPGSNPEQQQKAWARIAANDDSIAARLPLLNDILRLGLDETPLTRNMDPAARHESLLVLVSDILRLAASTSPLVLILEDAHWLDPLSWELALVVSRALAGHPLLLILVMRPLEEPWPEEYTGLRGRPEVRHLRLTGLSPAAITTLAAACIGLPASALPPPVADLIRQRSGGNPFFAEETALALRDQGLLHIEIPEEGTPHCALLGGLEQVAESIPDTIEGIVLARIDRLPPGQDLTLKVASVIGQTFSFRTLRDVHPQRLDDERLHAHLALLSQRDLTLLESLDPEPRYTFKHIITRQVAYGSLLFAQRRELHRAVAHWYETAGGSDPAPHYQLLAHHWTAGEVWDKATEYSILAAQQSQAAYAYQAAREQCSHAIEILAVHSPFPKQRASELEFQALLTRSELAMVRGEIEQGKADVERCLQIATTLADPGLRIAALNQYALLLCEGFDEYEGAQQAAREAIRLAQRHNLPRQAVRAYRTLGKALKNNDRYQEARNALSMSISMWEEIASPSPDMAETLIELAQVQEYTGEIQQARDNSQQAIRAAQAADAVPTLGRAYALAARLAYREGDYESAVRFHQKSLEQIRRVGHKQNEAVELSNLGVTYWTLRDYQRAIDLQQQGLDIYQQIDNRRGMLFSMENLSALYHEIGLYPQAREYVERGIGLARQIQVRYPLVLLLVTLGRLCLDEGDQQGAEQTLDQAAEIARDLQSPYLDAHVAMARGILELTQGKIVQAKLLFSQALEKYLQAGEADFATGARSYLAFAQHKLGNIRRAVELSNQAIAELESSPGGEYIQDIYWHHHQIMLAYGDEVAAATALSKAYHSVRTQAETLADPAWQARFRLVPVNRKILAAWETGQS